MKIKLFVVVIFVVLVGAILSSCGKLSFDSDHLKPEKESGSDYGVHKTKDGKIGFLIDGYEDIKDDTADLKCKSDDDVYMLVFVYNIKDFKLGTTKKDVLDMQIEDLMSKRKNPKEEAKLEEIEARDKTIYQKIYTADKNNSRFMYCFNVIDFEENEDLFAFVLFSSSVSYGEKNTEKYNDILKTAEIFE